MKKNVSGLLSGVFLVFLPVFFLFPVQAQKVGDVSQLALSSGISEPIDLSQKWNNSTPVALSSGLEYLVQFSTSASEVTFSPDNGDAANPTVVPANQVFTVTFSGALYTYVNQTALNNIAVDDEYIQGCIQLKNADDATDLAFTAKVVSWTAAATVISVTPAAELQSEKHYTLIVLDDKLQIGVKNVHPLGNSDFNFDVFASNDYIVEDTNAPMLDETRDDGLWQDGYYVGSGETILTNDYLKLDFTEAVKAGSGLIRIYTWNGNLVKTIDASALTIDANDQSIVIVSGVSDLAVGTDYYVVVAPGAITDLAGNPFAGVDEEDDWSFTVMTDQKPDVMRYSPTGKNITTKVDLMIEFDTPVELGAGTIILSKADGTVVQTLDVATDISSFWIFGNTVFIDINDLEASTAYMVSVSQGAFVSSTGEQCDAIAAAAWQFETEVNEAPLLLSLTPADDSVDVPLNQQFVMTFNMDVQAGNGIFELHMSDGSHTIVATFGANSSNVTISGTKVTIDLSAYLKEGTDYFIIVYPDFVQNTSATPESFAGILKVFNWNFTTVSEKTAPEVLALAPDNTTISDNHPTFIMTFDEAVQLSSTGGNIYVYKKGDSTPSLTIPLTAGMFSNNEVTITYVYDGTNGLAVSTEYYVIVDAGAIEDLAGNDFAGITSTTEWTFTTGQNYALGIGDELADANSFIVYPNPFADVLYLTGTDKINRVIITNMVGQPVKEVYSPNQSISTSDLRHGMYIISLMLDDVIVNTQRIIKR